MIEPLKRKPRLGEGVHDTKRLDNVLVVFNALDLPLFGFNLPLYTLYGRLGKIYATLKIGLNAHPIAF